MPGSFELKKTADDQFMFNLRAGNSECILTSERYKSKQAALGGIDSVKRNASNDDRYEKRPSGSQFYFVLKAANHEIIGTSERYSSEAARDNGIESVKNTAPEATTNDLT